ncbi:MAG: rRNA maturation RNase YbeY [Rikenellaceae bacterium]
MAINISSGDLEHRLLDSRGVKRWLKEVILEEGFTLGDVVYVWCSDDYLLDVNRQYLNHDYYTDIISFDYSQGKKVSGDLMISLDRVRANALEILGDASLFHVELRRVMVHGVLHLCGYKDSTDSEQAEMTSKEDYYLGKYEI